MSDMTQDDGLGWVDNLVQDAADEDGSVVVDLAELKAAITAQREQWELEAMIEAFESADRAYTHERDPQQWIENQVEKCEAQLQRIKKGQSDESKDDSR